MPVLRQQAFEVLDKKGEGGDEINLLREFKQKNRGGEIISIGTSEALALSKQEEGIAELKALQTTISESGKTASELSAALLKYNQLAAVASSTDPRFHEISDAFSIQLKESMTNVWTTISSEGCSIVKDFCESLLEGRPFDPARAAQVLQQIELPTNGRMAICR